MAIVKDASPNCNRCKFGRIKDENTKIECRRNPPTIFTEKYDIGDVPCIRRITRFPTVEDDCWCGEYKNG